MKTLTSITKTRLFKYTENFTPKIENFQVPTIYVFSRNKKNNVYPCKPQFYYIKVGFEGVKIT